MRQNAPQHPHPHPHHPRCLPRTSTPTQQGAIGLFWGGRFQNNAAGGGAGGAVLLTGAARGAGMRRVHKRSMQCCQN